MVFFGSLNTAQILFYAYFLCLLVANIAFISVHIRTKENWVRARNLSVYIPCGISMALHIVNLGLFLSKLDDLHAVTNNAYPVPEEDLIMTTSYVALMLLLYVMPPLFQTISFFAYARELGLYYEQKSSEMVTEQQQETSNYA